MTSDVFLCYTETNIRRIRRQERKFLEMDKHAMWKILEDTAYIRTGGSREELRCAEYIRDRLAEEQLTAQILPFSVPMATMHQAVLTVDGEEIPCEGYLCSGNANLEAPFYYLRDKDPLSLSLCRDKIVMIDGRMGYWMYQDVLEAGALGFITWCGDLQYPDRDIDIRELRSWVHKGNRIPGVNINVHDAVALIRKNPARARIRISQEEYTGHSHNVILDMPGEVESYIAFTAHYDSTALSQGAYDNMSGAIGLLALAAYFAKNPHRYSLRFIWCGSEERGLLGSKAYCEDENALKNCVLNINLDMIGCLMGKFAVCCTTEEALVSYTKYLCGEIGFPAHVFQEIYSSDSTPFADKGIPAVSFARWSPEGTAPIHCRYDTMAVMSMEQLEEDIGFIRVFADRMANAARCPVAKTIPDNLKERLDEYLCRKRPKAK